jgi:hypothetical protein
LKADVVYIHNGILAIKKSEIMLFIGKWIELEIIRLSEVSQVQKDKGLMFSLIWKLGLKIDKSVQKYINDPVCVCVCVFVFAMVGLFEEIMGRWESKRLIVNNTEMHCICA